MISFFPAPYPDELVYSWFARYGMRTGYTNYRAIAEDLFISNTAKPNLEFIIELNPEAYKVVTRYKSFEAIIKQHTMFPYYVRFLPKERRVKAYKLLLKMDKGYNDALYSRKYKTQCRQSLRYCPMCVDEDRNKYGETYWHRIHQLDHIDICPVHGCVLLNTSVDITSRPSPSLIHTEEVVPKQTEEVMFGTDLEFKLAQYTAQVFQADVNLKSDVKIGQFLHSRIEYTKYLSTRGEHRYTNLLFKDLQEFYKGLPNLAIKEEWQLGKMFSNYQFHTYDICYLTFFLNVPVSDLVRMALPKKSQVEKFDEEILKLHEQGLNYRQISNIVGASYDYCKLVAYRKLRNKTGNAQN